jgi:hypothetical protein
MYGADPMIMPVSVSAGLAAGTCAASTIFATPKSSTFTKSGYPLLPSVMNTL